ncbi:MAG: hypothetical protein QMD36_05115 [Candidatus Aenigmarchaeota archaeon]|nr:hypothetical protein [Candidatus Aenigmarchaeota archaeon]
MVCWVVPTLAATIEFLRGRKSKIHKNSLNLMFLGGALFGIIDHLWNGELFLISENWVMDLALGFTITGGIIGSWFMIISTPKITDLMRRLSSRLGISH